MDQTCDPGAFDELGMNVVGVPDRQSPWAGNLGGGVTSLAGRVMSREWEADIGSAILGSSRHPTSDVG